MSLCQRLCLKEKFHKTINDCFQKWKRVLKQIENISLMQYPQLFDGQLFCWFSVIMHHISREVCGLLEAIFLPKSIESIFLTLFYI